MTFQTYLHPHCCATSRPVTDDMFVGYGYPHYKKILHGLAERLSDLPSLPVRHVPIEEYLSVHDAGYLDKIKRLAAGLPVEKMPQLTGECSGYWYALPGYEYGLGGLYEAVDQMAAGQLERSYHFALGGHHSFADKGHGYCLLNPMAAAVRYAQAKGFEHIVIIDWDIHHGDGTQSIFEHDESVACISIHSSLDLYMSKASDIRIGFTDYASSVGHYNVPILDRRLGDDVAEALGLPGRFYGTDEVMGRFIEILDRCRIQPDMVFIFAGVDGHINDCGSQITDWTNADFQALTRQTVNFARRHRAPVISVAGGGYNLPVTLAAAEAHARALAG